MVCKAERIILFPREKRLLMIWKNLFLGYRYVVFWNRIDRAIKKMIVTSVSKSSIKPSLYKNFRVFSIFFGGLHSFLDPMPVLTGKTWTIIAGDFEQGTHCMGTQKFVMQEKTHGGTARQLWDKRKRRRECSLWHEKTQRVTNRKCIYKERFNNLKKRLEFLSVVVRIIAFLPTSTARNTRFMWMNIYYGLNRGRKMHRKVTAMYINFQLQLLISYNIFKNLYRHTS